MRSASAPYRNSTPRARNDIASRSRDVDPSISATLGDTNASTNASRTSEVRRAATTPSAIGDARANASRTNVVSDVSARRRAARRRDASRIGVARRVARVGEQARARVVRHRRRARARRRVVATRRARRPTVCAATDRHPSPTAFFIHLVLYTCYRYEFYTSAPLALLNTHDSWFLHSTALDDDGRDAGARRRRDDARRSAIAVVACVGGAALAAVALLEHGETMRAWYAGGSATAMLGGADARAEDVREARAALGMPPRYPNSAAASARRERRAKTRREARRMKAGRDGIAGVAERGWDDASLGLLAPDAVPEYEAQAFKVPVGAVEKTAEELNKMEGYGYDERGELVGDAWRREWRRAQDEIIRESLIGGEASLEGEASPVARPAVARVSPATLDSVLRITLTITVAARRRRAGRRRRATTATRPSWARRVSRSRRPCTSCPWAISRCVTPIPCSVARTVSARSTCSRSS